MDFNMSYEDLVKAIQDRIEDEKEYLEEGLSREERTYSQGRHDALLSLLDLLQIEHNEEYFWE